MIMPLINTGCHEMEHRKFLEPLGEGLENYLSDESRMKGEAAWIARPKNEQEVLEILRNAAVNGDPVTVSSGRTGIVAGAVPSGGIALSMENMNHINGMSRDSAAGPCYISLEPGVSLSALDDYLAHHVENSRLFFPPDPTEKTAHTGGGISCNSSGARSFGYGPMRRYVRRLRVALATGQILDIPRGKYIADENDTISIRDQGLNLCFRIPRYAMPKTKNAAGYWSEPGMDLIDLFIGSEGTLGVITEAELNLLSLPPRILGALVFLPEEHHAVRFVQAARIKHPDNPGPGPHALEYFDADSLDLLRQHKADGHTQGIPPLPSGRFCAVYYEVFYDDEKESDEILSRLESLINQNGGSLDDTWAETDHAGVSRIRDFRHALPETINTLIGAIRVRHPGIIKLGTDFSVPDEHLQHIMRLYRKGLEASGLSHIIFGHIGDNHLHINILPRDEDEYSRGRALYARFADEVIRLGGSVAAEHGIGKLKKALLRMMIGDRGIDEMRRIKGIFDPKGLLNPGNLF